MWIVLIVLNLLGFVTPLLRFFDESLVVIDLALAAALSIAYLPMGLMLIVWYSGKLGRVGIWMIVRILVVTLLPIAWYIFLGDKWSLALDIIVLVVELIYAIVLRDVLTARPQTTALETEEAKLS